MSPGWCVVVIADIVPDRARPQAAVRVYSAASGDQDRYWLLAHAKDQFEAARITEVMEGAVRRSNGTVSTSAIGRLLGSHGESGSPPSAWLLAVAMAAPASEVDELDRWYRTEHVDLLLQSAAWRRIDRYAVERVVGANWTRLALHDVDRQDVFSTDAVRKAMSTPWRQELARRAWFLESGRPLLQLVAAL